jgi:tetratricopeptide (TPR) repeat protein
VHRLESGDGRMRFGLPEALRQIAAELLDAAPDGQTWRLAHAQRQYDVVWAARTVLVPRGVYRAAIAADPEVAAAVRWAQSTCSPLAAPLIAARGVLLADNGHLREAIETLEQLLASPPADPNVHSQALWAYAWALTAVGRSEHYSRSLEEGQERRNELQVLFDLLGHPAASDLRALGRAVPAGGRVAQACELGRARLLA